jgi:hypothetical protein
LATGPPGKTLAREMDMKILLLNDESGVAVHETASSRVSAPAACGLPPDLSLGNA